MYILNMYIKSTKVDQLRINSTFREAKVWQCTFGKKKQYNALLHSNTVCLFDASDTLRCHERATLPEVDHLPYHRC